MQDEPAASGFGEIGQSVPATEKSPLVENELINSGPVPELSSLTAKGKLVTPTLIFPKPTLEGLKVAVGLPGGVTIPVPSSQVSL